MNTRSSPEIERVQFPLSLDCARTIHKVKGLPGVTLEKNCCQFSVVLTDVDPSIRDKFM